MLSTHEAILASSNPRGHFLQLLSVLPPIAAHSFIRQVAIEHLMVLGTEDPEMIKTQALETAIWSKYAFYIDKIAVKLKKRFLLLLKLS